jgi:uncharacterized protein YndB with AHSA1/START domain
MTTRKSPIKKTAVGKIIITRLIKAPCHLVFRAWTDPKEMAQWFSPEDVECRSVSVDLRIGGAHRIHMVSKKGDHIATGQYKQIVPNKLLQFTWHWEKYAMPESVVTVEFEDLGKTTRLTFVHEGLPDQEDADDHKKGWTSAIRKFARLMERNKIVPTKAEATEDYTGREFVITREYHAPRELVFKAWTDAKQVAQWWGPRGFSNPVCEWDARPGNAIHVVMRAPNGTDYPMDGQFHEIVAPERLVFTSGALDGKGKMLFEFLHSVTFAERKGKTMLTIGSRVLKTTAEANKYIGGFEAGMTQSLMRLAEYLAAKSPPLVIERTFNAPIAKVWKAITNKDEIKKWSFDIKEFKPEVGFEFQFCGEKNGEKFFHLCKVTEAIRGKKLAYSWRYKGLEGNSLVTFELFAEGKKTRLKLTHKGLETFPKTPNYERANFVKGWTEIIGKYLKEYVETTPNKK